MKEFDYKLNYKNIDFKKPENRKLYRIGRGEQGVLLVRPYQILFVNTGDSKIHLLQEPVQEKYTRCLKVTKEEVTL